MSQPQRSPAAAATGESMPPPTGNFFFLGCFGFSGKNKRNPKINKSSTEAPAGRRRKRPHWLSFPTKGSTAKTVPVATAVPENPNRRKPVLKLSGQIPARPSDQKVSFESSQFPKIKHKGTGDRSILEDRKGMDDDVASNDGDNKCHDPLSTGCKDKTGCTHHHAGSPEKVSKPRRMTTEFSLPPPPPKQKKPAASDTGTPRLSYLRAVGVDPGVGFLIVTLTLAITLVWGRLCAIFCVSAFLYIIPRFRASIKVNSGKDRESNSYNLNSSSKEYKNKVVFRGFLERSHRNSFVH